MYTVAGNIVCILRDTHVLADARVYTEDRCDQKILVSDMQYIRAGYIKKVTLEEGLQELLDHYNCNVAIDKRYLSVNHSLVNLNVDAAVKMMNKRREIQDRDCRCQQLRG